MEFIRKRRDARSLLLCTLVGAVILIGCGEDPPPVQFAPAPASTPILTPHQPAFGGVDVVFVVDQSGSMSGDRQARNDPEGLRVEAVWAAISRLNQDARASDPPRVHRVSVIEFGSEASDPPIIQGMRIADDPLDPNARSLLEVVSQRVRPKNLAYTNTLDALETAAAELARLEQDRQGLPSAPRVGRILLLTDGRPEIERVGYLPEGYLERMNELLTNEVPADALWVAGIVGEGDYWAEWQTYWQTVAAGDQAGLSRVQGIPSGSEIRAYIRAMLTTWMGGEPPELPPPPAVSEYLSPPYLKSLLFDIELTEAGGIDAVSIDDPVGRRLPRDAFLVPPGSRTAQVVVDAPMPGVWSLQGTPPGRYEVTAEPLFRDFSLAEPLTAQTQQTPIDIAFQVASDGNSPFAEDPAYPISATLRIVAPSGADRTVDMRHEGDGRDHR